MQNIFVADTDIFDNFVRGSLYKKVNSLMVGKSVMNSVWHFWYYREALSIELHWVVANTLGSLERRKKMRVIWVLEDNEDFTWWLLVGKV